MVKLSHENKVQIPLHLQMELNNLEKEMEITISIRKENRFWFPVFVFVSCTCALSAGIASFNALYTGVVLFSIFFAMTLFMAVKTKENIRYCESRMKALEADYKGTCEALGF